MTGFTAFLLEQGIETQLPISLNETLSFLEEKVPTFTHEGHGYLLAAVSRGQLGVRWELAVKVTDLATGEPISDDPVGSVHAINIGPGSTDFVIPPPARGAVSTWPISTPKGHSPAHSSSR